MEKDIEDLADEYKASMSKTFDDTESEDKVNIKLKKRKAPKGSGKKDVTEVTLKKDGRSITSKTNAMKHGKYATLPIYCNDCYYRAEDAGGNGKCAAYLKDSVCTVKDDIKKHCATYDTRDPETLKDITNDNIKLLQERVMFSVFTSGMDGNLLDKATNAQMNTLHQFIRLAKDLNGTVKITAEQSQTEGDADFISNLFKKVSVEKS